jgi:hypothetical protein
MIRLWYPTPFTDNQENLKTCICHFEPEGLVRTGATTSTSRLDNGTDPGFVMDNLHPEVCEHVMLRCFTQFVPSLAAALSTRDLSLGAGFFTSLDWTILQNLTFLSPRLDFDHRIDTH